MVVAAVLQVGSFEDPYHAAAHDIVDPLVNAPVVDASEVDQGGQEGMDMGQHHMPKVDMVWRVGAVDPAPAHDRCCLVCYSEPPMLIPISYSPEPEEYVVVLVVLPYKVHNLSLTVPLGCSNLSEPF